MLALAPALQHHSDVSHRTPSAPSSISSSRPSRPLPRKSASLSSSVASTSTSSSSTTPSASRSASVAPSPSPSQRIRPASQSSSSSSSSHNGTRSAHSLERAGPLIPGHSVEQTAASVDSSSELRLPKSVESKTDTSEFDVHSYPSCDLLRLLASLLTQIAATNDALGSPSPQSPTFLSQSRTPSLSSNDGSHPPIWHALTTASRTALAVPSSSLAFHARNIPTISLESYLLRILKYCPTTNEVFLSLLVYFDRMSKLSQEATAKTFVIDSYNIHRLVIAGVTVASKFFSDVFYTNSRYAKVGGLPQIELNQLELQFLLLNDFHLMISTEEMQRYAEQLILFSQSPAQQHRLDTSIPPAPLPTSDRQPSAPMQAMGAVDAYGGRVADDSRASSHSTPRESDVYPSHSNSDWASKTPNVRPFMAHRSSSSSNHSRYSSTDSASEADTETEYDGETDDEPTIRPNGSDTQSLYSVSSVDDRDDSMGSP